MSENIMTYAVPHSLSDSNIIYVREMCYNRPIIYQ